jgi:hypothetical protein
MKESSPKKTLESWSTSEIRFDSPSSTPSNQAMRRAEPEIGKKLRAAFDDVIQEPVPDGFLELLDALVRKGLH